MWTRGATVTTPFKAPPSGPGPVLSVVATGTKTNDNGAVYRQGDYRAPILQPWAAEIVRAHAESEHEGKPVRSAKETCSPMGVPYILELNLRAEFIDNGNQIVFLYEELTDHRIVRIECEAPRQSQAELVWRYGRTLGGRYAGGRYHGPERSDLDRRFRYAAYRQDPRGRALSSG